MTLTWSIRCFCLSRDSRIRMMGFIHDHFTDGQWQHRIFSKVFKYIMSSSVARRGTAGGGEASFWFGKIWDSLAAIINLILQQLWEVIRSQSYQGTKSIYICIFTIHLSSSFLWFKTNIFHCLWLSSWVHWIYDNHNISNFIDLSIIIRLSNSGHIPTLGGCY